MNILSLISRIPADPRDVIPGEGRRSRISPDYPFHRPSDVDARRRSDFNLLVVLPMIASIGR